MQTATLVNARSSRIAHSSHRTANRIAARRQLAHWHRLAMRVLLCQREMFSIETSLLESLNLSVPRESSRAELFNAMLDQNAVPANVEALIADVFRKCGIA